MNKNKGLVLAISLLSMSVLSGCAVMSEEECALADWYQIGISDGSNGEGSSLGAERREACAKYKPMDVALYKKGRKEGAEMYCTDNHAFNLGTEGESVTDICSISSNYANFNTYYNRGYMIYEARSYVNAANTALSSYSGYMSDATYGAFYYKLRANYEYLSRLLPQLQNYQYYVESNAWNGNIVKQDYSRSLKSTPYPNLLNDLKAFERNINEAEDKLRDIRHKIDDASRCSRDKDKNRADSCRKKYDCLVDAERRLSFDYREYERNPDTSRRMYDWNRYDHRCH